MEFSRISFHNLFPQTPYSFKAIWGKPIGGISLIHFLPWPLVQSHLPTRLDVMLVSPAWHAHVILHPLDRHDVVSHAEESARQQGDDVSTWTSPLQNCQLLLFEERANILRFFLGIGDMAGDRKNWDIYVYIYIIYRLYIYINILCGTIVGDCVLNLKSAGVLLNATRRFLQENKSCFVAVADLATWALPQQKTGPKSLPAIFPENPAISHDSESTNMKLNSSTVPNLRTLRTESRAQSP